MMKMTKGNGGLILAVAVAVGLASSPIQAQMGAGTRGPGARVGQGQMGQQNGASNFRRGGGPNMGGSLEALLEKREELGLTGDQMRDLEGLKATMDGEVAPLVEGMKALQEKIRAGEVERGEGFRQMQALRGELLTASAPLQGRVQEILTVEQHKILQGEMRELRMSEGRGGMAFQGRGGMAMQGRGGMAMQGRGGMAMQGRGRSFQGRAGSFRGGPPCPGVPFR